VLGVSGEQSLASGGVTVRCLQRDDGTLPDADDDADAIAYVARAY
jgi:prolyl-tRNA synthetase